VVWCYDVFMFGVSDIFVGLALLATYLDKVWSRVVCVLGTF
jgi:hypothetical protein